MPDGDGVEHYRRAARGANLPLDVLADGVEVHVAGHDVGVAVDDRD